MLETRGGCNGDRKKCISIAKEELPSVAGPDGLFSTGGGDGKNLSLGIGQHVDSVLARLIGDVSDKATVWRKRRGILAEFRGQNGDGFFAHWQHPEISNRNGMEFEVNEESPVRRPRPSILIVLTDEEGFRLTAVRHRYLVEFPVSGAPGRERDPAAIRVPGRAPAPSKRVDADENVDRCSRNVKNPDRPIVVVEHNPLAVR